MKIIKLKENGDVGAFEELIKNIYPNNPGLVKNKLAEYQKGFNPDNPFKKFGKWQSFLSENEGTPIAHITSVIDTRLPEGMGVVGFYECINDYSDAQLILKQAIDWLANEGKSVVRGPINLTTWQTFRFSLDDKAAPYFSEPYNPFHYPKFFEKYGFNEAQKDITAFTQAKKSSLTRYEKSWEKIRGDEFEFLSVTKENFNEKALLIHKLINEIFADTWNFVPISQEEFIYNYNWIRSGEDVYAGIIKDKDGKAAAFYFAHRDMICNNKKRLVFKIIGVRKEFRGKGLGDALLYEIYRQGIKNGYDEFIFSTMRGDNSRILQMVGKECEIFREYKTYELIVK